MGGRGVWANVALGLAVLCKVAAGAISCDELAKLSTFEHCSASPVTQDGKLIIMVQVGDQYTDFFENWYNFAKPHINTDCMTVLAVVDDEPTLNSMIDLKKQNQWAVEVVPADSCEPKFNSPSMSLAETSIDENTTEEVSAMQWAYKSQVYKVSMASRPRLVNRFLANQCAVVFSDIDIVWRQDVFVEFLNMNKGKDANLYAMTDHKTIPAGASNFCGGFLFFNPTPWNLKVTQEWSDRMTGHPGLNQPVLNDIIQHAGIENMVRLPQEKFLNGRTAEISWENATTVHANWMVGREAKKKFLQDRGLWNTTHNVES